MGRRRPTMARAADGSGLRLERTAAATPHRDEGQISANINLSTLI